MNKHRLVLLLIVGLIAGCSRILPEPSLTNQPLVTPIANKTIEATLQVTRAPSSTAMFEPTSTQITPTAVNSSMWPTPIPIANTPVVNPSNLLPGGALLRQGIGIVLASALDPKSSRLALGTATGLYIYQVPDLKQEWGIATDFPVRSVSWSPDGSLLLTGYNSYASPALWTANGQRVRELDGFLAPQWSPDGSLIAVPYLDHSGPKLGPAKYIGMKLYDGRTGAFMRSLTAEVEQFSDATGYDVLWSPDSKRLAVQSGGWNYYFHVWSVNGAALARSIDFNGPYDSDAYTFSKSSELLGFNWVAPKLTITNLDNGETFKKISLPTDIPSFNYAWSHDRQVMLASGSNSDSTWATFLLDPESGELLQTVPMRLESAAFSRNYHALLSSDAVYITQGDRLVGSFQAKPVLYRQNNEEHAAYWLPDGRLLVVDEWGGIYLLDTTGRVERSIGTSIKVRNIRWAGSDIQILASPSCYKCPGDILQWDVSANALAQTGEQALKEDFINDILDLTFAIPPSQTIDRLISSTGHTVEATRVDDGVRFTVTRADGSVFQIESSQYTVARWSPNGETLLLYGDSGYDADGPYIVSSGYTVGWLGVVDVVDGTLNDLITFDEGIASATWSPDSRLITVGLASTDAYYFGGVADSAIVLIDATTGNEVAKFKGHSGGVTDLAWSPDGAMLASASDDGTVIVWDTRRFAP